MKNCKLMKRVALLLLTLVSGGSCLAQTRSEAEIDQTTETVDLHQDPKNPTYYYGTWYDGTYSYDAPTGTEVWYAEKIEGDVIRLKKSSDNIIYDHCGVILRSTSQSNKETIEVTLTDRRTIAGHSHTSALKGTDNSGIVLNHEDYVYYVLNATKEHGAGFYRFSSTSSTVGIPGHRAYFEVEIKKNSTDAARPMLLFDFDDSPTGIDGVESDETCDNRYYNLAGQCVAPATRSAEGRLFTKGLKKGIYIVNGKKVIVR